MRASDRNSHLLVVVLLFVIAASRLLSLHARVSDGTMIIEINNTYIIIFLFLLCTVLVLRSLLNVGLDTPVSISSHAPPTQNSYTDIPSSPHR